MASLFISFLASGVFCPEMSYIYPVKHLEKPHFHFDICKTMNRET
jgi:hypothetical protein